MDSNIKYNFTTAHLNKYRLIVMIYISNTIYRLFLVSGVAVVVIVEAVVVIVVIVLFQVIWIVLAVFALVSPVNKVVSVPIAKSVWRENVSNTKAKRPEIVKATTNALLQTRR